MKLLTIVILVFGLGAGAARAQEFRCDWHTFGVGSGELSSGNFRAQATAGQTATGRLSSTDWQAFIGYWQIDTASTGIQEQPSGYETEELVAGLQVPSPLLRGQPARIRCCLAVSGPMSLRVFGPDGRLVRVLATGRQRPGRYEYVWHADDAQGRRLASGVYFVKLLTDGYAGTRKLVVQ